MRLIKISALLLLGILTFSVSSSFLIKSAKADECGWGVFLPNNVIAGVDSEHEVYYSTVICNEICWMLYYYYTTYHYSWYYQVACGSQQDPIHPGDYSTALDNLQTNNDKVTFFSKGHCVPWGYSYWHRELLCTLASFNPDNGEEAKDSYDIWPYTGEFKNRFSFIWHCGTADQYPQGPPYQDPYGLKYGMPFCFTHNMAMDYYGSSGSYVYLGWISTSPQFDCFIPYQTEGTVWWFHFAYYFFYSLIYEQYLSVMDALNILSNWIWDEPFNESPYYGHLIVWGNGNMGLSY